MKTNFLKLNNKIIKCNQCSRLVKFRKKIAANKRKQYINEKYWGKPVTGFGDINGEILLVGLAPAAHGGTEPAEYLQAIDLQIFYINAYIKQKCLINQLQKINMMD